MRFYKGQLGFTIVELLLVIVIIGVLASITIVAYSGAQNKTHDTVIKFDLSNAAKKFEIYRRDYNAYPTGTPGLMTLDMRISRGSYALSPATPTNFTVCYSDDGATLALTALSKSGRAFYLYSPEGMDAKPLPVAWDSDATARCKKISPTLSNFDSAAGTYRNYNGYSVTDTTTGPWRAWVGGN